MLPSPKRKALPKGVIFTSPKRAVPNATKASIGHFHVRFVMDTVFHLSFEVITATKIE